MRSPSKRAIDMSGQTFGFLTVLRREGSTRNARKKRYAAWRCRCTCGEEVVVIGQHLRNGRRKACAVGGHHWTARKIQGLSIKHPSEYSSWRKMRERCADLKRRRYGGRGILVCTRWDNFALFLADMGLKPTPKHTIERNDTNGNYEKENCRWATRKEQSRNQCRAVYIEYGGERMLLMDLCARLGLDRNRIYQRLKLKWSLEEALTAPLRRKKEPQK